MSYSEHCVIVSQKRIIENATEAEIETYVTNHPRKRKIVQKF